MSLLAALAFFTISALCILTGRALPVGAVRRDDNPLGFWCVTLFALGCGIAFGPLFIHDTLTGLSNT